MASTAVCVLGDKGKVLKEADIASEPEALISFIENLPWEVVQIGLEAGPLSQWLYKGLSEASLPVVLMETRRVKKALKASRIKTDRRDAQGLAHLLQVGWFSQVHCKSKAAQEVRAMLTSRKSLQGAIINLELSVRGVLRNFGLKVGKISKGDYEERIRELVAGNAMLQAAVEPILRVRAETRSELAELEKKVRDMARRDPVCNLLMSMPGVGPIVALTFKAAVDDPTRFKRSRDIGPWVGLVPSLEASGERSIVGAITRTGDAGLRTTLYQAATVMLHRGPMTWLKSWALRTAARRGTKRATVALARRIGVILHRMWVDATEFRYTRDDQEARLHQTT